MDGTSGARARIASSRRQPGRHPGPLAGATLVFLAAPIVLFTFGWLRAPWSWLCTGAVVWVAWRTARALEPPHAARDGGGSSRLTIALRAGGVVVLAAVAAVNGAGGVGVQTWDWAKHTAILADLVSHPWPVTYRLDASDSLPALVYYVAYYLPAAVVGKWLGWGAANGTLFVWTVLGLALTWLWLIRISRASPVVALGVFVLFTGLDVLGAALSLEGSRLGDKPWWVDFDLEWWLGMAVLPGNVTLIAYAPHQALGGWLTTALVLDALRRGLRGFPLIVPIGLSLLWSPFTTIGVTALAVTFLALRGIRPLRRWLGRQRGVVSLAAGAGLVCPLVVYFAARLHPVTLTPDLQAPAAAHQIAGLKFLPWTMGLLPFARGWAWLIAIEVLPVAAAIAATGWLARRRLPGVDRFGGRLLGAALVVLAIVPFVSYGYYNDWAMRVSIPPLFALQVLAARALSRATVPPGGRALLAAVLVAGGLYPLAQLRLHAAIVCARGFVVQMTPLSSVEDLFTQQRLHTPYYDFARQYIADARAPFFRYLAGPLEPRAPAPPSDGVPQPPAADPVRSTRHR